MYTVERTAPRFFTEKFQVTKHKAEAPIPKKKKFPTFCTCVKREKSTESRLMNKTGIMNSNP